LKRSAALFAIACVLAAPCANAETAEIKNPSWQEVPGTAPTANTDPQFSGPAYIDINGIERDEDLVIFDIVNSDASYSRVEGNCKTNQFRPLRFGHFETQTTVIYQEYDESWKAANEYQGQLLRFACSGVGSEE